MSKKNIKRYKVSPNESLCLAVSVVDKPAVESDFLFFNEQKLEKFVGVDGERRMIYGCALRADFPIYRNNGEEEYYLEFDKEAIDKLSKNYFKMGFQANWTAGHKSEVEGLTITESWIKESMTMDKSISLGLDPNISVGSWFIGCYCENDEIWQKVKDGTYHGFSCEALIGLEEFESQINKIEKENDTMEVSENFWKRLKTTIFEALGKTETIEPIEPEALEANEPPVEQPTVEEVKVEEPEEPIVETPTVEEKPIEEEKPTVEEVKEEPKQDDHLAELVNNLKSEIEALKEVNSGLQEKIKSLGKQPSAKPVNTNSKPNPADTYSAWRSKMAEYLK